MSLEKTARAETSNAKQYRVMTAVGGDRPGLVEKISAVIHAAGANLEDSRMAILGGEFALILLLSGSDAAVETVTRRCEQLKSDLDLEITLRRTLAPGAVSSHLPCKLKVSGLDRPGIVAQVSSVLANLDVNVAALDSRLSNAPLTGTPLFQLEAELQVPSAAVLDTLRANVAKLCDEESLDFTLDGRNP